MLFSEDEILELGLLFKGNRKYLHGTDIFNKILELTSPVSEIKFQLNNIMQTQISLVRLSEKNSIRKKMSGTFIYNHKEKKIVLGIFENGRKIKDSYEYNEDNVIRSALFFDKKSEMASSDEYSFIERLVALNKAMLLNYITTPTVKWYFTFLEIKQVPRNNCSLRLNIKQELGIRLVLSDVEADGINIGSIGFSGVA